MARSVIDQQVCRDAHGNGGSLPYRELWTACFLGYAAIGMTIQVIPAYVQEHLAAGPLAAGFAVTIGALATMIARPIAGRMADQRGGRRIVMVGSVLGFIGGLAHLIASNLAMLIVARLILGAGEGALFTAAIGWVLSHAEAAQRGKIAGHFGLSMWAGLASGPVLGAALFSAFGFNAVWTTASLLPLLAWFLLLRAPHSAEPRSSQVSVPRAIFPRAAWIPGATMMFASIGYGVIAAFLVARVLFLDMPGRQFALAIFGTAFLIVRFLGSPAVDRWGAIPVLVLSCLAEALGLLGLSIAEGPWSVAALIILTGAGISMLYPCLANLVVQTAHLHERGAALGSMTSAWDLGFAVGGPLGGIFAGATVAAPFAIGGGAALIALVPLAARRSHRTEDDQKEH